MPKLQGALDRDSLPIDVKEGSWSNARNIVVNKRTNVISNEDGTIDVTPVISGAGTDNYPNKSVIGTVLSDDDEVLFFATTTVGTGEIGVRKSDGKYYPVIRDTSTKVVLNLNPNFPTQAVAAKRFNSNTIIAFKDADGVPKIINIDCLPFTLDSDYTVTTSDVSKAKAIIKLFPDYSTPIVLNMTVEEGQGTLQSGVYYPIISYELSDGSITSYTKIYNGIPIVTDQLVQESTGIGGGQSGHNTNKAIALTLVNIDFNYKRARLGYIYFESGQAKAYFDKSFLITTTPLSVLLTGANKQEIDLSEVLQLNTVYNKVQTLTSLQKTLYLGGLEQPEDYNYQPFANLVTVAWKRNNIVSVNGQGKTASDGGTYQNPRNVFFNKTFKSGEVVALYLVIKYKNGMYSKGFHIAGRPSSGTDKDIMTGVGSQYVNYNGLDNGNPVYRYQVLNTNSFTSQTTGTMGFWENENEEYPLDPANPANIHPDFANIPGVSTSNRKVRHHVFPDLTYLGDSVGPNSGNTEKFIDGTLISTPGTYPVDDITTKVFGIVVSNVSFDSAITPYIDSWEIHYAERTNANIRIIASDCISSRPVTSALVFQPFDLMTNKANLTPSYVKPLIRYTNNGTQLNQEANFVEDLYSTNTQVLSTDQKIVPVSNFAYQGQDTTIPYNNSGKADNTIMFMLAGSNVPSGTFDAAATPTPGFQDALLCDLCIFRRDVYLSFNSQNLVATGYPKQVFFAGPQPAAEIYGGDVYINRHSVNVLSTGTRAFHYVCESASNIGYRNEDLTNNKFFAPKYPNPTPSWFGYNKDYNCINNLSQIDIYYPPEFCIDADITKFPNRISYSVSDTTEGSSMNWRIFKVNSYFDSANDKGRLWNILGSDKTLYIHHEFSLFIASIKDQLNISGGSVALGVTQIFDRPPTEVIPIGQGQGFAGTQSQYACISCRIGYCFIDRKAAKVFIYGNTGLREISSEGLFNFFLDNVEYTLNDLDNPFIGHGYIMSYDTEYNRLLITKSDIGMGATPFTLSYTPDANNGTGGWVSFHDYFPSCYISNRDGLFGIDNVQKKFFEHNYENYKAKYYSGAIKKSYIEYIANMSENVTKLFQSIIWRTTCENIANNTKYPNETFTHILVYNDTQCSGEVSLKLSSSPVWYSKDVRNVEGQYNYNDFRDMIKDVTIPFLDKNFEVIGSNIDSNKPWYNRSQFIHQYCVFRLITDNTNQKDLHLSFVMVNFKKSDR